MQTNDAPARLASGESTRPNPKDHADVMSLRRLRRASSQSALRSNEDTMSQCSHPSITKTSEHPDALPEHMEVALLQLEDRLSEQFAGLTKQLEDLRSTLLSRMLPCSASARNSESSQELECRKQARGGKASLGNIRRQRIPQLAAATFSEEPCPPAPVTPTSQGPVLLGHSQAQCLKPSKEAISDDSHEHTTTSNQGSDLPRKVSILSASSSAIGSEMTQMTSVSAFAQHFSQGLNYIRKRSKCEDWLWYFLNDPESSKAALMFSYVLPIAVCCSVLLAYIPRIASQTDQTLSVREFSFDAVFSVLLTVRFVVCPNKCAFFRSIYNYIDFLVGPLVLILRCIALSSILVEGQNELEGLLAGMVPVLRLLMVLRQFETFTLILSAFKTAFEALPVLLFTLTILITLFSTVFWYVEPGENVPDLQHSMYLTIMTLTSVGYGDLFPVTGAGRAASCILSIIGAIYMAIPLGIVGSAFSHAWDDRDRLLLVSRTRRCLHQVGCTAKCIPELFFMFDHDKDGELSFSEFKNMLLDLKIGIREERMFTLFQVVDKDGSGAIDDQEFVRALFTDDFAEIYGFTTPTRDEMLATC